MKIHEIFKFTLFEFHLMLKQATRKPNFGLKIRFNQFAPSYPAFFSKSSVGANSFKEDLQKITLLTDILSQVSDAIIW